MKITYLIVQFNGCSNLKNIDVGIFYVLVPSFVRN